MSKNLENEAKNSLILDLPKFINPSLLSSEQLTNPDYRLNRLQQEYGKDYSITCSKCHHCR